MIARMDSPAGKLFFPDEIMAKRSNPAVIIMDREDRLLYFNQEAQEFLQLSPTTSAGRAKVPKGVSDICEGLKESDLADFRSSSLIRDRKGRLHVAMAHFIHPPDAQENLNFIIVIQPVAESRIDFQKVKEQFDLSPRELEVLGLICDGHSNREISEKLFISEYTTRDHLKNIMRKMGVSSRSKIIAQVI
jgi:DNA-binding CsgD family transcriptional regulator